MDFLHPVAKVLEIHPDCHLQPGHHGRVCEAPQCHRGRGQLKGCSGFTSMTPNHCIMKRSATLQYILCNFTIFNNSAFCH